MSGSSSPFICFAAVDTQPSPGLNRPNKEASLKAASTKCSDFAAVGALLVGAEVVVIPAAALVGEDEAVGARDVIVPAALRHLSASIARRHRQQTRGRCPRPTPTPVST